MCIRDRCIQCNQCALVCPHSALRPVLLSEEEKEKAPGDIGRKAKPAAGCKDKFFYMGISRPDCTGCGNCISAVSYTPLFALMMMTMMLPQHAIIVPQYVYFYKLGWIDSFSPLVIPKDVYKRQECGRYIKSRRFISSRISRTIISDYARS